MDHRKNSIRRICTICGRSYFQPAGRRPSTACGPECRIERMRRASDKFKQRHPNYHKTWHSAHREKMLLEDKKKWRECGRSFVRWLLSDECERWLMQHRAPTMDVMDRR